MTDLYEVISGFDSRVIAVRDETEADALVDVLNRKTEHGASKRPKNVAEPQFGDHERGLYDKYRVERLNDDDGKHDDCRYFVLDIRHDPHAREALIAYVESCKDEYPKLTRDLIAFLTEEPGEPDEGRRDEMTWVDVKEAEHEALKRAENNPDESDGPTAIVRPQ